MVRLTRAERLRDKEQLVAWQHNSDTADALLAGFVENLGGGG
jgi:hypothetical protein